MVAGSNPVMACGSCSSVVESIEKEGPLGGETLSTERPFDSGLAILFRPRYSVIAAVGWFDFIVYPLHDETLARLEEIAAPQSVHDFLVAEVYRLIDERTVRRSS